LDSSNPANWMSAELKVEIEKIGIKITENLSNKQLRRIYLDNKKNSSDNVGSGALNVIVLIPAGQKCAMYMRRRTRRCPM
jgi:hypothetical protein